MVLPGSRLWHEACAFIFTLGLILLLGACGGSDSGSGGEETAENPVMEPVSISVAPQSVTAQVGHTAGFTVTAAGSAPFSYQWRRNGVVIEGATAAEYTTPILTLADSGSLYDVVVGNPAGSVTSATAMLTVAKSVPVARISSASLERQQVNLNDLFEEAGLQPSARHTVRKIDGPDIEFAVAEPYLNLIGPPDSGFETTARLLIQGESDTLELRVHYGTERATILDNAADPDEAGNPPQLQGRIALIGTRGTADDLVPDLAKLGFRISAPELPEEIYVYVTTRRKGANLTALYDYDRRTGLVTLKPDKLAALKAHVGMGPGVSYDIVGKDLQSYASLIYAPSRIKGRIINSRGEVQTALKGRRLVLEGGLSTFTDVATIEADGSFSFPAVPVESFNLELLDVTNDLIGRGAVVISATNQELNIDLVVSAWGGPLPGASPEEQAAHARLKSLFPSPASQRFQSLIERGRTRGDEVQEIPQRAAPPSRLADPVGCEPTPGTFRAVSGLMGVNVRCEGSHAIGKGTQRIQLTIKAETAEFPGYSPRHNNPFNDRWEYDVRVGSRRFSGGGRVNDTHATRGSDTLTDECLDLGTQTASAGLNATVQIGSTNIGDSVLSTTVSVLFAPCAGLEITDFRLERQLPDNSAYLFRNTRPVEKDIILHHVSLPSSEAGYKTFQFPAEIRYSPKDATISSVKLLIEHAGGTLTLAENALVPSNEYTLSPGLIRFSKLRIPPASHAMFGGIMTLRAELKGTHDQDEVTSRSAGARVENGSKKATEFIPLFEVSQHLPALAARRYSTRDEALGLDGWGTQQLLTRLTAFDWIFNDITAQHTARTPNGNSLLGHLGHGNGRQVDVRYWDADGRQGNGPLNGRPDSAGKNPIHGLIDHVCAPSRREADGSLNASAEANPRLATLVSWVVANRTALDAVMARSDVLKIHIAENGSRIHAALALGHCPGAPAARIVPTAWQEGSLKLAPARHHDDHWHVNFDD
ncbi:MAG: hypothetical protein REI09_13745 [Candidatus Dactylopiibacterium sp.]|nr:hypothetical protein [Candidatus Dactylopiibacterium sp.]